MAYFQTMYWLITHFKLLKVTMQSQSYEHFERESAFWM